MPWPFALSKEKHGWARVDDVRAGLETQFSTWDQRIEATEAGAGLVTPGLVLQEENIPFPPACLFSLGARHHYNHHHLLSTHVLFHPVLYIVSHSSHLP